MVRILICGGRDYNDRVRVYDELDAIHSRQLVLIHGNARGADRLADEWALDVHVPVIRFPANWKLFGKRAGPIRNQEMIDEGKPIEAIAFPGVSGTDDICCRLRNYKIPYRRLK